MSSLEDISSFFVFPYFYDLTKSQVIEMYAYPYGIYNSIFTYSEPIAIYLLSWLAKFFDPHSVYNLFVIISAALAFVCTYKLIGLFTKNKAIQTLVSLNYVFSPYFIYQSRAHPQLMQIWMPILFLYLYFKDGFAQEKINYKRFSLLGIFLCLTILTSNYLGYFLLLFLGIYTLVALGYEYYKSKKINYFRIINNLLMVCIASLFSFAWLYPFITVNYVNNDIAAQEYLSRPLEDFIYFSSRPWYYVLPSVDNPFFGTISQSAISALQTNWGHYLTSNYFKTEHAASYLGVINLIMIILGLFKVQKDSRKIYLNILLAVNLVLISLTFPPYIIVNSHTIYLPSFLLYKIFPMFRVLSRLSFLINLINLIFVSYGYSYLFELKKHAKYVFVLIFALFLISFSEMYVPYNILKTSPNPKAYVEMYSKIGSENKIAVYPKEAIRNFFYWTRVHQNYLINPVNFKNKEFDANKLTSALNTCEGLQEASTIKTDYIVVYGDRGQDFFKNNKSLELVYQAKSNELEQSNKNIFYKIEDMTLHPTIYVYKLNDVSCK